MFRAAWKRFFASGTGKKSAATTTTTGVISDTKPKELQGKFNANSPIEPVSAAPTQIFADRVAIIYRPSRNLMQSGNAQTKQWRLDFNPNVPRWENSLMGWSSSRDPIQGVSLKFASEEAAIAYAKDQGWAYEVKEDSKAPLRPKSYAENFTYSPGELKIIRPK